MHEIKFKAFVLSVLAIAACLNFVSIYRLIENKSKDPEVLGEVTTTASVYGCVLDLTVYTEDRQPATNNWGTDIDVKIYDSSDTFRGQFTATTNNLGKTTIDLCDLGIYLVAGQYDFFIYGRSHLSNLYPNIFAFNQVISTVNLSYDPLVAGETSLTRDEEINSLDLTTQIAAIGSVVDETNDVDQDGIVDADDIAVTISNLYMMGEVP